MVPKILALVLLLVAATTSAESQKRPSHQPQPQPVGPEPCIEPVRALTVVGLATAYVAVLGHASVAESLTAYALNTLADSTNNQRAEAALADVLYSLDAATREYRCAGQVLDPFKASPDSDVRAFAKETHEVFDDFARWVVRLTAQLRRRMSGGSLSLLGEADTIAAMHTRRDALTKLFYLNEAGMMQLLVEDDGGGHSRIALASSERESVAEQLRSVSNNQSSELASGARMFLEWITDPKWRTR
jgi:hypothetical protein